MRFALTTLFALLLSVCYAQNVGIGITTPAVPLHIRNNGSELLRIQGNDPYLSFFNNSGIAKGFVQGHGDNLNLGTIVGNPTGLVQFFNNNNLNMVIHPNSNVGIGTDGPSFKLTVQTANDNYGIVHRSNNIIVGTWIGTNSGGFGGWYGTFTDHPLNFFTNNGGPQITLTTAGNVGIGTTSPIAKLHINANGEALRLSGTDTYFTLYNGAGLKGYMWNKNTHDIELGTDDTNPNGNLMLSIMEVPRLVVQNDGRVRVGAVASNQPVGGSLPVFTTFGMLCIKDNFHAAADEWTWRSVSGAIVGLNFLNLYKNGVQRAYVDDDGDWNSTSDISLKEDVKPYKIVLNDILKLQVSTYHYKWNTKTNKSSFGLIAQNVAKFFPELVSETEHTDGSKLLGISYAKTGVLAIKAIQEQQQIIEAMQKIIAAQQMKADEYERRLAILENRLR